MTAAEIAAISARAYKHMSPWSEADIEGTLDHALTVLSHDGAKNTRKPFSTRFLFFT